MNDEYQRDVIIHNPDANKISDNNIIKDKR